MIGDTLADVSDPRPLPGVTVDEPAISMTFGVNTSPLAGQEGSKLTARLLKGRLDAELVGNVSVRVIPTERPDTWEVQGRGELALAVLVELMRREGFELTVGKPQVLTKVIDGKIYEPVERVSLDIPEEHLGTVTQLLAAPQGPDGARRLPWERVGAHGLAGALSRPHRAAFAAADRHQGNGAATPRPRRLGTLVRRDSHSPEWFARCRQAGEVARRMPS